MIKYSTVSGAIVYFFSKTEQSPQILLIKQLNSNFWGFPKGHQEEGESLQKTAIREVKEETGLSIIPTEKIAQYTYDISRNSIIERKTLHLFLASPATPHCIPVANPQPDEIEEVGWFFLQDALPLMHFQSPREILLKTFHNLHNPYL